MSLRLYVSVFSVLIGVTIAELGIITLSLPSNVITTSLIGSAGLKAVLIALFFQHLKDEPKFLSSLLILGLIGAMILTTLTFLQVHVGHVPTPSLVLAQAVFKVIK